MPWADHRLDQFYGGGAGLKLISKIPEGEVCNYLGIMDTLGGPGNFRPHLDARLGPAENVGRRIYRSCRQRRRINYNFFSCGALLSRSGRSPSLGMNSKCTKLSRLYVIMHNFAHSKPHPRIFLLVESLRRVYNFGFIN